MKEGEKRLVERAKAYDEDAFAEIYERYYGNIYNYIYYKLSDGVVAEDLASEVFLKALQNIDSFTFQGTPISAWLYRIAQNLLVDYYRGRPQEPELPLEEDLLSTGRTPAATIEKQFTHEELREALGGLTEAQQDVIILKFVEGLSNAETAGILGKTEGAVKSLQHRALNSLERILGTRQ